MNSRNASLHLRSRASVSARLETVAPRFPRSSGQPGSCWEPPPPQSPALLKPCGAGRHPSAWGGGRARGKSGSWLRGEARTRTHFATRAVALPKRRGGGGGGRKRWTFVSTPLDPRTQGFPAGGLRCGCPPCARDARATAGTHELGAQLSEAAAAATEPGGRRGAPGSWFSRAGT